MTIVAYGYGLQQVSVLIDGFDLTLDAEPDIVLDPDLTLTLAADDIVITVDPDIDIEVE